MRWKTEGKKSFPFLALSHWTHVFTYTKHTPHFFIFARLSYVVRQECHTLPWPRQTQLNSWQNFPDMPHSCRINHFCCTSKHHNTVLMLCVLIFIDCLLMNSDPLDSWVQVFINFIFLYFIKSKMPLIAQNYLFSYWESKMNKKSYQSWHAINC